MSERISTGDIVVDKEDDDPSPAVVVNRPPIEAHEWKVKPLDKTVAKDNPDYPDDERIAMIVYKDEMDETYPHYTGGYPIKISKLIQDGTRFYTFPRSRLKPIGGLDPIEISISNIRGNKYHSRNFNYTENKTFIEEIGERGYPEPIPLVRDTGENKFEIISGHKRTWAAATAGLNTIYCEVIYADEENTAKMWASRHLHEYTNEQRKTALSRLSESFDNVEDIIS